MQVSPACKLIESAYQETLLTNGEAVRSGGRNIESGSKDFEWDRKVKIAEE